MNRIKRAFFSLWTTGLVLCATTGPVLAQEYYFIRKKDNGVLQWAVFLGILILLCIAGFMNPKRSHMD